MFVSPGDAIYPGMIIGAHSRDNDLDVNPAKGKQLTNIRTTSKDEAVRLTPPIAMSLEEAIAYIEDDELVEVTPKAIRLRKRRLDANDRKRAARSAAARQPQAGRNKIDFRRALPMSARLFHPTRIWAAPASGRRRSRWHYWDKNNSKRNEIK